MKVTQNRQILKHLSTGEPITPVSALVNFGVARLAARIEEIRSLGYHKLNTTMKSVNGKRYASYRLDCIPCQQKAAKEAARTGKLLHMRDV